MTMKMSKLYILLIIGGLFPTFKAGAFESPFFCKVSSRADIAEPVLVQEPSHTTYAQDATIKHNQSIPDHRNLLQVQAALANMQRITTFALSTVVAASIFSRFQYHPTQPQTTLAQGLCAGLMIPLLSYVHRKIFTSTYFAHKLAHCKTQLPASPQQAPTSVPNDDHPGEKSFSVGRIITLSHDAMMGAKITNDDAESTIQLLKFSKEKSPVAVSTLTFQLPKDTNAPIEAVTFDRGKTKIVALRGSNRTPPSAHTHRPYRPSSDRFFVIFENILDNPTTRVCEAENDIDGIAFNNAGTLLAVDTENTIALWDLTKQPPSVCKKIPCLDQRSSFPHQMAFNHTDQLFAYIASHARVNILDLTKDSMSTITFSPDTTEKAVTYYTAKRPCALAFSPQDNLLAIGTKGGDVYIYDIYRKALTKKLIGCKPDGYACIGKLLFSNDGKKLLAITAHRIHGELLFDHSKGTEDYYACQRAQLFNVYTGEKVNGLQKTLENIDFNYFPIPGIAFSQDSQYLIMTPLKNHVLNLNTKKWEYPYQSNLDTFNQRHPAWVLEEPSTIVLTLLDDNRESLKSEFLRKKSEFLRRERKKRESLRKKLDAQ